MTWLSHFWGTFKNSTRTSRDAKYLSSEKNQAHLKVPDKKLALAIEGLGLTSTALRDILPNLSKPVKHYDERCTIPPFVKFGTSFIFNLLLGAPALSGEQHGSPKAAQRAPVLQVAAPSNKKSKR